ncbi:hypothetical protein Pan258_05170 [Symmachiella dynata]|uniref:hypothetical protein n=1 Tax=Symmachiella dynata TaxID=2527995 RepID=UPI00118C1E29|nr:hypothetical protein [Symmachiella dynata]QDT46498.1 hypothetical protein Pan258_05170 [Symmachiella dynata]
MRYFIKIMLRLYRKLIPQSRAIVLMGMAAAICFLILTVCFPHPFFFFKLLLGLMIGVCLIDLLSPKLGDAAVADYMKNRRGRLGMLLAAPIVTVLVVTLFVTEEQFREKIRQLTPADIASISIVELEGGKNVEHLASPASVAEFCRLCRRAELFYTSHEATVRDFQLRIQYIDGRKETYEAGVFEAHQGDMAFSFRSFVIIDKMIIPGGRPWLDKIATE